jgi:rubrerythrin
MVGVIRRWDILAHPLATIRCFGWPIFFRALFAGDNKTFLSLLPATAAPPEVASLLQRCIELELRAKRIYTALAKTFTGIGLAAPFFATLAKEEQDHADLLELCRSAALRGRWKMNLFNPWQAYLPRLEQQMDSVEASVYTIDSLEAALSLVLTIECSEVNHIFHTALAATDAAFVKRLKPFREAMEVHMGYILDRVPELAPQLSRACDEQRAKFPRMQR